jgi:glutamyl-tRNA synthetase
LEEHRTALFNWLFSKNQKGKFLLRIEDTDVQRSKDEYYEQIVSTLKWLEINWDEEPYIQSKNIRIACKCSEHAAKKWTCI